jgi:hypothetical protein
MALNALLTRLEASGVVSADQPGKDDRGQDPTPAGKRQVSCRAFAITKVLMATKPGHCLDRQGDHCGDCVLRVEGATVPPGFA